MNWLKSLFKKRNIKTVCCSFHKEYTGSMVLDFDNDTFKCFGCGVNGELSQVKKVYARHKATS